MRPSASSMAAPTRNLEKGAKACRRAARADAISRSSMRASIVGRSPWTAADALVGLLALRKALRKLGRQRDEGVPRRPGGLPHNPPCAHLRLQPRQQGLEELYQGIAHH